MSKIKLSSIHAFFLRHLYPLRRDFDLLSDMIYWPLIDTALWGITGQWLVESSGQANLAVAILLALILWNVIWRAQAEVARNLMDEIWNNNLVNFFATPITVTEWVLGVILLSVVKTVFTIAMLTPVVYLMYAVNVFYLGWWLLPFFLSAVMTGWWIGLLSAGIVLRYGPKVQTVIWTLPGILLPFSAIYFPLDKLPALLQPISRFIPTTYVFESMRGLIIQGDFPIEHMVYSFTLNIIFLVTMIFFFVRSFDYSKKLGLGRFQ